MRFKEFLRQLSEEQGGSDNGLMGIPKSSSVRKPSDGQPFKNLAVVAGAEPRGNSSMAGGTGQQPMFMKKKMKKA